MSIDRLIGTTDIKYTFYAIQQESSDHNKTYAVCISMESCIVFPTALCKLSSLRDAANLIYIFL